MPTPKKSVKTPENFDQNEQKVNSSESKNFSAVESSEKVQPFSVTPQQDFHIAELDNLKEELRTLAGDIKTMKQETNRVTAFNDAIRSVKQEISTTQALLTAPNAYNSGIAKSAASKEDCGCGGNNEADCPSCNCVSAQCCCFDIIMTHFRVVHMQSIEPTDTNIIPTNMLELRFFASIDPINNIGALIPSLDGWLVGHKGILEPIGMWVPVHKNIGTKCIKKGASEIVNIELTVLEVETPLERVQPANRDEYGSSSQSFSLDCCSNSYPPIIITVALTGGGLDVAPGVIDAKFAVVKKC